MTILEDIRQALQARQDETYCTFHARLIPTVDPARIIGVRVPHIRALAKRYAADARIGDFLATLPHRYYEEDMLHGLIIAQLCDYDACIAAVDAFLPYVDNWAVCDSLRPRCFAAHKERLRADIRRWIADDAPYTVRFGIEMAMVHFLDDAFDPAYAETIIALPHEHYYVRMMIAWYVATALAKQWDAALPIITTHRLPAWTHRKAIQKAKESYRLTNEQKAILTQYR